MDDSAYRRLFTRLADSLSKRLIKILIALFALLLLAQLAMQIDVLRGWLSLTYRMEGDIKPRAEGTWNR